MSDLESRLGNLTGGNQPVGTVTRNSDGAVIENAVVRTSDQKAAFEEIFDRFGLSPDEYRIVDDTVVYKSWQSFSGEWLYSYGAKLAKGKSDELRPEVFEAWRKALREQTIQKIVPSRPGGTYLILVADSQFGKVRTDEAVENWRQGIAGHLRRIDAMPEKPSRIHVAFMGDEHEGVANHYGNQPYLIELNRTQQLELDFDMRVWTLKEVAALGLPLSVSSVISNHGEWTRNGSKDPVTTQSDNSSTYIMRQVKRLFDELEDHTGLKIEWTIGETEPGITLDLSGVKCYFTHGYIEKGRSSGGTEAKVKAAMERQILGKTEELGDVRLFITAHYHHFHAQEFEGRTLFGCPALEAEKSSDYMLQQYGIWSPPGLLGFVVDSNTDRGWRDLEIV